jgi:hypothetical protein
MNAYTVAVTEAASHFLARGCQETTANRGPCVDEIKRIYGNQTMLNEPWCAEFVYAMHRLACMRIGAPLMLPQTKGALDMLRRSKALGLTITRRPIVGAVMARRSSGAPSGWHVGQVAAVQHSGAFACIEGNLSNRVGARTYTIGDLTTMDIQFIDLPSLYTMYVMRRQRLEWY